MNKLSYEPDIVASKKPKQPESFFKINQTSLLLETQLLDFKVEKEQSIQIFMKIIYLMSQGIKFEKKDQDILFFRITRVFESQNEIIRRFACLVLNILNCQDYAYVLQSCIARDIISSNVNLKLNALKLLPLINDQQNLVQIERLWSNVIVEENQLVCNSAIVSNLLRMKNKLKNYHALILLYQISRGNEILNYYFIKLLNENTKKDATPLFKIHLIRYIKEKIHYEREQYRREFVNFIFKELDNRDKMVALEAAKALISIQTQVQDIEKITFFLKEQFELEQNVIIRHFILQLYFKLVNQSAIVLTQTQIRFLQKQSYDKSISISSAALKICLTIYKLRNFSDYLTQLYQGAPQLTERINFLNGLKDLVLSNIKIGEKLNNLIQTQFELISEYELMKAAIHFIQSYISISKISEEISIKILLNYANSNIAKVKYAVIVLLRQVMREKCPPMDDSEIDDEISRLKIYFKENNKKNKNQIIAFDNLEQKYKNNLTAKQEQEIDTSSLAEESHLIKTIKADEQ
ncbi:hypothetical protein pb186bvf_000849 [Paramecium bursaria]